MSNLWHLDPRMCSHSNDDVCPTCDFDGYYADTYPDCPWRKEAQAVQRTTVGMCRACGAIEVYLNKATGRRDFSSIGESAAYPTGYGCELCA